jgi:hypothetical protein
MQQFNKKRAFSFLIFILSLFVLNADVLNFISTVKNQLGSYIYPLDDTYIHLAVSKNLAGYGVWGITKYQFSNTSSSPLFTLLLAALIKIFGDSPLIPLYVNIVLGNALMFVIYISFRDKPIALFFVYLGFILCVLLKVQIVSGMEHVLQLLVICSCWIYFYKWYQTGFEDKIFKRIFLVSVSLLCITRYESLFFVTPLIIFLLFVKKYKAGIITFFLAYTPIIIFGLYSIAEGGHFFPNSVLIKGKLSFSLLSLLQNFLAAKNFIISGFYLYLVIILLLFLLSGYSFNKENISGSLKQITHENLIYSIIFITIIGHLMFAHTGWLYRYDAYLIALLILSVAFAIDKIGRNISYSLITVSILFSVLLLDSFKSRYQEANRELKFANKNIHDQQIQMAKLLKESFNNSTIVANDIGAISYFSDIRLYDLAGLGTTDIFNIKQHHPAQFETYVNSLNYDLMIVYNVWNINKRKKIAELTIQDNHVCGADVVSFYVPEKSANTEYAYAALEKLKKEIPKDITLNIFY